MEDAAQSISDGLNPFSAAPDFQHPPTSSTPSTTLGQRHEATQKTKTKACDVCHKRKVKCDNAHPACTHCVKFNAQCTYESTLGPRKKITRRRLKRADILEERVNYLEDALRRDLHARAMHEEDSSLHANEAQASSHTHPPNPYNTQSTNFICDDTSFLSPSARRDWIPEQYYIPPNVSREHSKTITRQQVAALLNTYFDKFNRVIPIFDQSDIFARFSALEMDEIRCDMALWTAISVMCALAYRFKAMTQSHASDSVDNDREAWVHLQSALDKAARLAICGTGDLLPIQALLGMTVFMQAMPDANPSLMFFAAAVRLLHWNGLQVQGELEMNHGLGGPGDRNFKRQQNRVFWVAYFLDHDLSLRLGRPPLMHEDDIDVPLPAEDSGDGLGYLRSIGNTIKINYFRLRTQLAVIQGHIRQKLYTVRASRQSSWIQREAIQGLGVELDQWMSASGLQTMQDRLIESGDLGVAFPQPDVFIMRLLYLAYLNCHTLIHGLSFQSLRSEGTSCLGLSEFGPLQTNETGPPNCCVTIARASLSLLPLDPSDHPCNW
ncbi:hypothetical protein AK830_g3586 [Neonectria ditissima]|uniref:Zn(2)-C6 fungal-type domain-containing protein n=1 Tax=Neonectria ditissima TaxID=78410 RepID=A0A0P7BNM8_9HYPO|nr:hypothetical protein AK830_g3586 [Neonectria ditissima]